MKYMNKKRFASTVMAGVLALSLATPAFAAATQPANSTVIEGAYEEITIAVSVPDSGEAQINPYGLPVSVRKTDETTVTLVDQQITTKPLSIKNQGTIPLDVGASLAVVPKGDVSIKGSALAAATDKGKEINATLEVAALNDDALKVSTQSETLNDLLIDRFANDATWAGVQAANKLVAPAAAKGATAADVTAAKSGATALATLGAATGSGESVTYGAKSIALFRLAGELNAAPVKTVDSNTVDDPWAATDGFTATIAFTFKPAAKLAITINATGGTVTASPSAAWEGTEVTLTATPTNAGETPTYVIKDANNKNVAQTNGKFTMPDTAVTITVTFA